MQNHSSSAYSRLNRTDAEVISYIEDSTLSETDIMIPSGFAPAFLGLQYNDEGEFYQPVYSKQRMIQHLMIEDKMSEEDAVDFLSYNTWSTVPPEGPHTIYIDEML